MSSIGEKIKEALTGHSQKDTSDDNTHDTSTPRSYPSDEKKVVEGQTNLSKLGHHHRDSEIGADHVQGKHDPEVDAKEATSQAGNYPYWGDLPREGEQGHTHEPGTTSTGGGIYGGASHNLQKGSSGLAAGALATGGAAAGSRGSEYEHRPLGSEGVTTTSTSHNLTDRTRDPDLTSSTQNTYRDGHKGELAAATGAGVAGATYLGTRHRDENTDRSGSSGLASGPTQAGPGSLDAGYASQTGSSTTRPQEVSNTAFGTGQYGTQDNTNHRKEEGALAAGAAGLGGAGYLAHKRAEDHSRTTEQPTSGYGSQRTGEQPTTGYGSQQRSFGLTPNTADNNQNATTRGDNSHHKEEAALAGAAGLGGAGYLAHKRGEEQPSTTTGGGIHNTVTGAGSAEDAHARSHKAAFDSSSLSSSGATTAGSQRQYNGGLDPYNQQQQNTSSSLSGAASTSQKHHNKDDLAAAAAVSAGVGAVVAEEKHRHHEPRQHDDNPRDKDQGHAVFGSSGKHTQPTHSSTTSQPSAQLAAQQAWNKQNQAGSGSAARHDPEDEARQATSAAGNYPYQSADRSTSTTGGQHHNNAALGAAGAGLAGAGATAAYYGQGREHDQNPRSDESQKIAERALGSDGAAHTSNSEQGRYTGETGSPRNLGQGQSSSGLGAAGLSGGSTGMGSSKVLHKCHQCGADNDISNYFNKDAVFRTEKY
ncbi:hypothetical protein N0V82_005327 [Gnomoniopsis sp. IMI 355080]|nr:hypothetical protein N0V82_005327 [Gnomoniopsis sp. IMI 355080]